MIGEEKYTQINIQFGGGGVEKKCPELLTKLYWHGHDARAIPWDGLPNQFVIKVSHGSGYNIICKNKTSLDRKKTVKKLNKWLREKYIPCYGENFYGKVKPSIVIEELLVNPDFPDQLTDYKVFCFGGKAHYIWVVEDRFSKKGPQSVLFDRDWKYQDVEMVYPLRDEDMKYMAPPKKLDLLIRYAELLSEDFPHVRVDMYIVGDRIVFGELSFSSNAGLNKIKPYKFDCKLGDLFILPEKQYSTS